MNTESRQHTGLINIGEYSLPILAQGEPTRIGTDEYILPAGDVSLLHPFGDTEFYRHGWNSWSPSGWRLLSEAPLRVYDSPERLLTADDAKNDTPLSHSGSAVGALMTDSGKVLLLGALGLGVPRVGACLHTLSGTQEVAEGEWFLALGDEIQVFDRYSTLIGDRIGKRESPSPRVWSSWYSCYEDISEELLFELLTDIEDYPFDVIQLDDGWEPIVGDWQANAKFPSGMEAVAHKINDAGFSAGLWLAPFIALPDSVFVRERRDWLLHDADGEPLVTGYNWGGPYYGLDTTHEGVQDHLRELFSRVRKWGFSYLKLDFMYTPALEARRHVDVPRETAYRQAIELIREAVGEDTYLLGSGVPILPSAGIFDGIRVGPDVAAFWDNAERPLDPTGVGAKNAIHASVHRKWLRSVFHTDPDAVYFRRRRSLLDEDQRQALQDLATMLRFKSTSDHIAWLDSGEREELRTWLLAEEAVEVLGRYQFSIDGRMVDLEPFMVGYEPSPSTNAG